MPIRLPFTLTLVVPTVRPCWFMAIRLGQPAQVTLKVATPTVGRRRTPTT